MIRVRIRKTLGVISLIVGFGILGWWMLAAAIKNPELTQTQLLVDSWRIYLLGVLSIVFGYFLVGD